MASKDFEELLDSLGNDICELDSYIKKKRKEKNVSEDRMIALRQGLKDMQYAYGELFKHVHPNKKPVKYANKLTKEQIEKDMEDYMRGKDCETESH